MSEPLARSFRLMTEGKDRELDALSIIIDVMAGLEGAETLRVLDYLRARFIRTSEHRGASHD